MITANTGRASALFVLLLCGAACSDENIGVRAGSSSGGTSASGTSGSAGMSAGGASGSAGAAGQAASSGGSSGAAAGGTVAFDFAEGIEGWAFVYAEPIELIPVAAAPVADAGADADTDAAPAAPPQEGVASAAHDPTVGDPNGNAGSVLLQLPFSAPAQKISFEVNVGAEGAGINLAGRSISARLKVDSGFFSDAANPAGVKLYVKTGPAFVYADSGYLNIGTGSDWQTFTWPNVSTAAYVDAAGAHTPIDVRSLGIELDTGAAGVYSPATVHLDTVTD